MTLRVENTPHGTSSGYVFWLCRCEDCKSAYSKWNMARQKRQNDESRDRARHHNELWTGPQLEIAARIDLSHRQVADMTGRTLAAVRHMRRLLREGDPKTVARVGLGR